MKRLYQIIIAGIAVTLFSISFLSQNCYSELNTSTTISFNQNPVFGFSPSVSTEIPITEKISIIPYSEFWFQNAFSDSLGYIYPGIELGIGAKIKFLRDKLSLLTSIGMYNGNSYSGGGPFALSDAVVPVIKLDYRPIDKLEFNFHSRAWIQGRTSNYVRTRFDQVELDVRSDYEICKFFDAGLFYNHLIVNQKFLGKTILFSSYMALGPSVTLKSKQTEFILGIGLDLVDYIDKDLPEEDKVIREYYEFTAKIKL